MRWYLPDGNPLLWDELRRRMRGGRLYQLLLLDVLLLVGVAGACCLHLPGLGDQQAWAEWGKNTGILMLCWQLGLVILLSPLLCVGSIAAEWERHTLEALWLAPISNWTLIFGKFKGAMAVLGYMLLAGMPVAALVAQFGGISPAELLFAYLLTFTCGAIFAALGLLASCQSTQTLAATLLGYGYLLLGLLLLGLFVRPFIAYNAQYGFSQPSLFLFFLFFDVLVLFFNVALFAFALGLDALDKKRRVVYPEFYLQPLPDETAGD